MKRHFPPELRTMAVIPRWSIVWTLTRDVVSSHSFFTTFYSREIAKIIGWRGDVGNLMFLALTHDVDEIATGDVVGPVKREIIDNERAERYIDSILREKMPILMDDLDELEDDMESDDMWRIIKAADRLDALLFLTVERRLGNGVISPGIPSMWAMMEAAWLNLPADRDLLFELWNTVLVPAVKEHESTGGFGI